MYLNSNTSTNTNIDSEFKTKKDNKNIKKILIFGGGGIFLVGLIITAIVIFGGQKYFITLRGEEYMTIYTHSDYIEPGFDGYNKKGTDLTSKIVVTSKVDTTTPGKYEITYKLNKIVRKRYVTVVESPVGATYIHLKGNINDYQLKLNSEYIEPGYVVVDTVDNDLSDSIKITNNIDSSKVGTYRVIYSVVNSSGVTTSAVRTVIVK